MEAPRWLLDPACIPSRTESSDPRHWVSPRIIDPLSLNNFPLLQAWTVYHTTSDMGSTKRLGVRPNQLCLAAAGTHGGQDWCAQALLFPGLLHRGMLGLGCRLTQGGTECQQSNPTPWGSLFMGRAWKRPWKVKPAWIWVPNAVGLGTVIYRSHRKCWLPRSGEYGGRRSWVHAAPPTVRDKGDAGPS